MMRLRRLFVILPLLAVIAIVSTVQAGEVVPTSPADAIQDAHFNDNSLDSSSVELIPEPATIAILGFGSVLLSRCRRRKP